MNAQSDKFSQFRDVYLKEIKEAGIVGSSFVFIKDRKIVSETHYGSANLEKKQPVNADTIYHWASNTKPFTGIAIMQLRDRGLLAYHMNDVYHALQDLEAYLKMDRLSEQDEDQRKETEQVWEHVKTLRRRAAQMN